MVAELNKFLLHTMIRELPYLRRVDDGAEIGNTHHTKVGNCKAATLEFFWLQLIFTGSKSQVPDILAYLQ